MDQITWLQKYYASCCNGDWEHTYGIKIDTLDNPGWVVTIDLEDTTLEIIPFTEVKWEISEGDWVQCKIENKLFKGYGGVENLKDVIDIFSKWVKLNSPIDLN